MSTRFHFFEVLPLFTAVNGEMCHAIKAGRISPKHRQTVREEGAEDSRNTLMP